MTSLLVWILGMTVGFDEPTRCRVVVEGMPVPIMGHHTVTVGDAPPAPLSARFDVEVGEAALRLAVAGPRYRGERFVSRGDCAGGQVVPLQVSPLPARLEIRCPPEGLTVTCTGCPGEAGERVYLAGSFPEVPMDSFRREVVLLLRAPGFRSVERTVELLPGPNSLHVELERL